MQRVPISPTRAPTRSRKGTGSPKANVPASSLNSQPLPRWTCHHGEGAVNTAEAAAFVAGAALFGLDQIVRTDPPWLGAWRMRQALAAAEVSARLLRLREDASALRDAHHLTRAGDDPGPGGRLHRAWRDLARGPTRSNPECLERFARDLGLSLPPSTLDRVAATGSDDPVSAAADAATCIVTAVGPSRRPEGEVLALMLADAALAHRLGWACPVPLLATAVLHSGLRRGGERRPRPGEPVWAALCFAAYGRAAREAHGIALDLGRKAERLASLSAKVRTRGGPKGIAVLLDDDAVAAAALTALGSDRAARRFLERLAALGAIRELTRRPAFRLYGL